MAVRNYFRRPDTREEKRTGKYAHITIDSTGKCTVEIRFRREDGSTFRWKRVADRLPEALRLREEGYRMWEQDRGVARDEARAKRAEQTETLRSWSDRAMRELKSRMAPTTHDAYRMALDNHVLPALGDTPLAELRRGAIRSFIDSIQSVHIACQSRNALSRVLKRAVDLEVLDRNPMANFELQRKKPQSTDVRFLTKAEAAAIMEAAVGTEAFMVCLLGLRFGCRIAESLALLWEDVDIEAGIVTIREQTVCVKGNGRLRKGLKHDADPCEIPIDDDVLPILRRAKEQARAAGHLYVCCYRDGSPLSVKHVGTRQIRPVVLAAGIVVTDKKPLPTAHDFRRSWITWMAQGGERLETVSRLARHRDVSTTAKFYVGIDKSETRSAVKKAAFKMPQPSKLDEALEDEAA